MNLIRIKILDNERYFGKKLVRQIFGMLMGSPLSPIISDIILQDLESDILNKLTTKLSFYVRYVDDMLFLQLTRHTLTIFVICSTITIRDLVLY